MNKKITQAIMPTPLDGPVPSGDAALLHTIASGLQTLIIFRVEGKLFLASVLNVYCPEIDRLPEQFIIEVDSEGVTFRSVHEDIYSVYIEANLIDLFFLELRPDSAIELAIGCSYKIFTAYVEGSRRHLVLRHTNGKLCDHALVNDIDDNVWERLKTEKGAFFEIARTTKPENEGLIEHFIFPADKNARS
jgi:hypothetical protein